VPVDRKFLKLVLLQNEALPGVLLLYGPGSASRQAIGTGVFFGMIFAVTVGILLVPFFFVLIYKMKAKMKQK
jgi:multidrug efflux pump